MNVERLHQVLRRPIVSEKSTNAAESGQQVVFEVLTLSLIHISEPTRPY